MENPIIQSVLDEESRAAQTLQAAREEAAALIRETQAALKQKEEETRQQALAHWNDCLRQADEISAKAARKAEEEAMAGRAVLRAASTRKMDRAAQAVLSYLQ
ncbi:MAG: hypothetical protein J6H18_00215 [Lachnospiraceae bacterium]|nr:hypothetical protein [Lachnospiraceae bacterium]